MELLNAPIIIVFTAAGVISGFLLMFLGFAYYKIYRADRITRELDRNRRDSYIHGSLNFNRH